MKISHRARACVSLTLRKMCLRLSAVLGLIAICSCGSSAEVDDQRFVLQQGFENPPRQARPRVWWHWMNGNVSKDGIRKDIEWMSRVGIGGLQNFDASLETPQIVDERLVYMSAPWKDAFRYTAELAAEHDLELAIASSPGWSETGGPWVPAENGMKKLVWSDAIIEADGSAAHKLPTIPSVSGPFQDMTAHGTNLAATGVELDVPHYSADIAVLAYRLDDNSASIERPTVLNASGKTVDSESLGNGKFSDGVDIPRGSEANPASLSINYQQRRTVSSLTVHIPGAASLYTGNTMRPVLEVATADGWQRVVDVPLSEVPSTISFNPVTGQEFRLILQMQTPASLVSAMGQASEGIDAAGMFTAFGPSAMRTLANAKNKPIRIAELVLHEELRVNAFELKAGFAIANDYYELESVADSDRPGVDPRDVLDLTQYLGEDGTLNWTAPEGRWRIIRLGYSLTGKTNHPATQEATGLEVDKYDGEAVRDYVKTYIEMYREVTGDALLGERGLQAFLTDSIEVGSSNWTGDMIARFKTLRGYDPLPWLPTLTGVVIGSVKQSDAFLYDFRRTLAELLVSEHYAVIADVADEYGLRYYSEALESMRATLGDGMSMRAYADIPMAAIWHSGGAEPRAVHTVDIRGAASVAHIHGQNLVAAESLTSMLQPWASTPAELRPTIDLAFANGVNRPVIHTSVHQPADERQPGLALTIFGQYFNRHETWAEMAGPWVDYLSRSSYLLQQGRNVADVAYFYGEEAPLVVLYEHGLPKDAPQRYAYDFINAQAVHEALSAEDGDLLTPGGARYRALYLGGSSQRMTVAMLRKLEQLLKAGATIVGPRPLRSPSLSDDGGEFDELVRRLWGGRDTPAMIINSKDVEAVLEAAGVLPDFRFADGSDGDDLLYVHRKLDQGDLYFLNNRSATSRQGDAYFRVSGKAPQLWRADSGSITPLSYRIENGQTIVPLEIDANDSYFVVFVDPAEQKAKTIEPADWVTVSEIGNTDWVLNFQSDRGAPESAQLQQLIPLNEHADPGIKYFSGIARYRKSFGLPQGYAPGSPLRLDLGQIGDVAEVQINGHEAGTVWHEFQQIDIGDLVTEGENTLEVRVANLWVNRLIGDAQPNANKVAWTSTPVYLPDAPLRPAGLIGPVSLLVVQPQEFAK